MTTTAHANAAWKSAVAALAKQTFAPVASLLISWSLQTALESVPWGNSATPKHASVSCVTSSARRATTARKMIFASLAPKGFISVSVASTRCKLYEHVFPFSGKSLILLHNKTKQTVFCLPNPDCVSALFVFSRSMLTIDMF